MSFSYAYYILPAVGGVLYYLFTTDIAVSIFSEWIPQKNLSRMSISLLIVGILFLICVAMGEWWFA